VRCSVCGATLRPAAGPITAAREPPLPKPSVSCGWCARSWSTACSYRSPGSGVSPRRWVTPSSRAWSRPSPPSSRWSAHRPLEDEGWRVIDAGTVRRNTAALPLVSHAGPVRQTDQALTRSRLLYSLAKVPAEQFLRSPRPLVCQDHRLGLRLWICNEPLGVEPVHCVPVK